MLSVRLLDIRNRNAERNSQFWKMTIPNLTMSFTYKDVSESRIIPKDIEAYFHDTALNGVKLVHWFSLRKERARTLTFSLSWRESTLEQEGTMRWVAFLCHISGAVQCEHDHGFLAHHHHHPSMGQVMVDHRPAPFTYWSSPHGNGNRISPALPAQNLFSTITELSGDPVEILGCH
jgi:hypothetical protein